MFGRRRLDDDTDRQNDQFLAMTAAATLCLSVQLAAAWVYLYDRLMKRLDTVNHLASPERQEEQGCICQIFTGGSEFRLAMTDRATIAGMEVAKLVPWNSLLN